jgi:hypothetical protein
MILRIVGAMLLVVMAIHVAVRPEQGWILLSGCDVATVVTSVGLIARWHRAVAISGLFQAMIGIPAFAIGVLTTYDINPTGIVIHVVPPLVAAIVVARHVITTTSEDHLGMIELVVVLLANGEVIALRLVDRARGSAPARS